MFEYMGERLSSAIKNIRGLGKITVDKKNLLDKIKRGEII